MYFISKQTYRGSDKVYGVTDTDDNVEEFYTKEELANMFHNHRLRIHGMTHTGSDFKFEVKTLDMVMLDLRTPGDSFIIRLPYQQPQQVLYLGQGGDLSYKYFTIDKKVYKLTREFLLQNKGCISLDVGTAFEKELKNAYKIAAPMSPLARFL